MKYVMLIGVFFASSLALSKPLTTVETAARHKVLSNRLAMTVASILVNPADGYSEDRISVLNRSKVPLMGKYSQMRFTYRMQPNKKAPLVFVLPGIGGMYTSSSALFTADVFYSKGYHTVTADNPFSWAFTVSGSKRGLPGFTNEDSRDMYEAMGKIVARLKSSQGVQPRGYALAGVSLGGLQALFIKNMDNNERRFGFSKVLIANPPLDLLYASKQLDAMAIRGNRLSADRKAWVFNRTLEVGQDLLNSHKKVDEAVLQKTFERLNFSDDDYSYLIGFSFRTGLRDTIFASQQVKDLGILKSKATSTRMNERLNEAAAFSFQDYIRHFIYPQVHKNREAAFDLERLNSESSMYQFKEMIQKDPSIYVFHSADDFILKATDQSWLQTTFGDSRVHINPYGGHTGGLLFKDYSDFVKGIL